MKDPLLLQLLYHLDLDADATAQSLAKKLRVKVHRVQYGMKVLRERYGIKRIPFVNYSKLSLDSYLIFFSIQSQRRKAIENQILRHPSVGWLGEIAGTYEYGCAFLAQDIRQVGKFLSDICDTHGDVLSSRQIVPRLSFAWYGRRYLNPVGKSRAPLSYSPSEIAVSIDAMDRRILSALANSGTTDLQQIAGRVGVPYSTAVRRIRNLESSGVIGGYLTSINPELLNREAYRMLIHTGTSSKRASEKMRAIVERDPRATFFVECLGPWEFEIGWELESASELSGITAEISSTLANRFVQVTVLNELSDLKWSFFPSEGVVG